MSKTLTFVLGGASSGKSVFAEKLCAASGLPRVYVATAQPFDAEMKAKVAAHRTQRGEGWQTIEAPFDPVTPILEQPPDRIVLFDCVTLWLTNLIVDPQPRDLDRECRALVAGLSQRPCDLVVVSNEVGMGIVPDNALSRRFRVAQGALNRQLAAEADTVVNVIAGLPQVLKGALPE